MEDRIDIAKLMDTLEAQLAEKKAECMNHYIECRKALLTNTDTSQTDKLLDAYEYAGHKCEETGRIDYKSRIKAAELFNKMATDIKREFDDDSVVDADNFAISFYWFGNTVNFPVRMIADRYHLTAGMFGFESSFTTHEAYTEDCYALHIGLDDKLEDYIKVDFGQLNKLF